MKEAASQAIDRCSESVDSYHKYRDYCNLSPSEVITQIENVKQELK